MKYYTIVLLLILSNQARAQVISPDLINTGSLSGAVNNIHYEFSLGEGFTTTIGAEYIVTQGFLQPVHFAQIPLPVLGLAFHARRINNSSVQLDWKTLQEINNKGFYVERKKESEINFTQLRFIPSAAIEGNSSVALDYSYSDTNSFGGKTYYRLRQEDIDGKFVYSVIRVVNGSSSKTISLKAWPVPSNGSLTVLAEGIEKDVLQVIDLNGRLQQQVSISNGNTQQITGLRTGIYFLRLAGEKELVQKIIVQ